MSLKIDEIDFTKGGGLVPAIIQDDQSEQVLMLGYMNEDAVKKTLETGRVTFYSRSRQELWTKGETSGNFLNLSSISLDCDKDTLLVRALPIGPTCHTGTQSCFGDDAPQGLGFLAYLEKLIAARKSADSESSYTAKLLNGPLRRTAQKVGEEGVETALAAVCETDDKLISEAADLTYHLMVLLAQKDIGFADIITELQSRHK